MRVRPSFFAAAVLCALAFGPDSAHSFARRSIVIEGNGSLDAASSVAACWEMVELLESRGWTIPALRVHVQKDPFDATRAGADLILPSGGLPEDNAALFVRTVVAHQLSLATSRDVADVLAEFVAARLAPVGALVAMEWEEAWQQRLSGGDLLTSALPAALWRFGGDEAVRAAASGPWPEQAYRRILELQPEPLEKVLGEVALAGLLTPHRLGIDVPAIAAPPITLASGWGEVTRQEGPRLSFIPLVSETGAAAVMPWRLHRAMAWVVVQYGFSTSFDVVALDPVDEVFVPLQGARWAAVAAISVDPGAQVSVNIRPVDGFPMQLQGWDFRTDEFGASLWWDTTSHDGVEAYLVEAVGECEEQGYSIRRRTVVPVAEDGTRSRSYAFSDDDLDGIAFYRLLAMTDRGLLAEIGVFPVAAVLR